MNWKTAVGAVALVGAVVAPNLGWACDYSQSCAGWGNQPIDCAAYLLGGAPSWRNADGDSRQMRRPNLPNPTAAERANCRTAVSAIYSGDTDPLNRATDACNLLVDGPTYGRPTWSFARQAFIVR